MTVIFDNSELAHCEDHDAFDEYCRDCDAAAYDGFEDDFFAGADAAYDHYTGK